MSKSVNLYLASGVSDGIGFWIVNFTEEDDIINSFNNKLIDCYRKELFGVKAAKDVKEAINCTLDILAYDSKIERFKFNDYTLGYSSEIPLCIVEDIFDLWTYNYKNEILWKKYIGLLNFRKKIKTNNNYINIGLKGNTYEFAMKLDKLLSFRPIKSLPPLDKSNDSMW